MAAPTVIGALRRFLPDFLRAHPAQDRARRRAIWAITRCRTAAMGGHIHACPDCGAAAFAYHSCNHRACPQCGKADTARWVDRELQKRVGAPYFMVTFTLPEELRGLFFGPAAKGMFDIFFAAASGSLAATMASPRWLGARANGFTMILHTWNQRLLFHPHIHAIVPGAGIDRQGRVVSVKSPGFLVPQPVLRRAFREEFRRLLAQLRDELSARPGNRPPPDPDPAVWNKDWGVHLQPFGDGGRAIQYLGAYVCRTAIGDSRILEVGPDTVTFSWTDRANGNAKQTETLPGAEFVRRYMRHVLPTDMRAIRRYGFCHPAAKHTRERVAFHTGRALLIGPGEVPPPKPRPTCPCCGAEMTPVMRLPATWRSGRDPPANLPRCA